MACYKDLTLYVLTTMKTEDRQDRTGVSFSSHFMTHSNSLDKMKIGFFQAQTTKNRRKRESSES